MDCRGAILVLNELTDRSVLCHSFPLFIVELAASLIWADHMGH